MNASSAIKFCKQATCPSSEMIFSYQQDSLTSEQMISVDLHLEACDFCGAEFQLLTEHTPNADEECPLAIMPLPLRRLAESLLDRRLFVSEIFVEPVYEKEGLTLTDA
jgi:hypothetical protein